MHHWATFIGMNGAPPLFLLYLWCLQIPLLFFFFFISCHLNEPNKPLLLVLLCNIYCYKCHISFSTIRHNRTIYCICHFNSAFLLQICNWPTENIAHCDLKWSRISATCHVITLIFRRVQDNKLQNLILCCVQYLWLTSEPWHYIFIGTDFLTASWSTRLMCTFLSCNHMFKFWNCYFK